MSPLSRTRTVWPLLLGAVSLALVASLAFASRGAAADGACRAVATGPFLYVDRVIPDAYVECTATQSRIRVYVELTRDGSVVRSGRRDCRNVAICHHDIDLAVGDSPGDQRWCHRVRGTIAPNRPVVEATSCEDEPF